MKKKVKIFIIIFAIIVIVILADTIQAKCFNNRPLFKITENYNGGNVYQKDKGILVYTYVFSNKDKITVFKWEKYHPPEEIAPDSQKSEEHYFYGKVIEANKEYVIVEPNENEEIRKSVDKISIGLEKENYEDYSVGTNVKVIYEGSVIETYPAQLKNARIEIRLENKFNLVFYQKTMIKPKQKETIISKGEIKGVDYNVYSFEGNVSINLNSDNAELTENSISLRDALLKNKITMDEIIEKANKDFPDLISYDDGGSKEYHYDNYTIIKMNKLNGNRDVYIGSKDMTIHDLDI